MKAIVTLLFCALLFSFSSQAQENKTIKEETTVKRIVKKEGSTVTVQEVEDVETEAGAVVVGDEETEDKFFKEETEVSEEQKVIKDDQNIDQQNEDEIAAMKKKQEEELQRSIDEANAKAAAERKALEDAEQARLKQMEENRKNLERRGKGVGKLSKKKRDN